MVKPQWKHPKIVHRLTIETKECECYDDEVIIATQIEDILDRELSPDVMNDLHTYYTFLYSNYGFEIVKTEMVEIWSWKEMQGSTRWRGFYAMYGDGQDLHV